MKIKEQYGRLADDLTINATADRLRDNGITVYLAADRAEAIKKIGEIIPAGAEVMNMTSTTLAELGMDKEIEGSGKFQAVRKILEAPGERTKLELKRLGAAQGWAIGSVHAVSQAGSIFVASATGSQLPAYAYGADNVLWVVGAQKIVKSFSEAIDRLYNYCLPLENERALKVYGVPSGVNKIFILNKEAAPERLNMIIVKEKLGF